MNNLIKVTQVLQRDQYIESVLKTSYEEYTSYDVYPGRSFSLKMITLPIQIPIYRMANGRTNAEQMQLIHEENLDAKFFLAGQENEDAQTRQHAILLEMADLVASGSGDSIYQHLRKNIQQEPLLISPNGVVLNGNRRLAAMRALYSEDPISFERYGHVKCAVLPNLTDDQELMLELRLQMSQNFKLDYSWVNEALMFRNASQNYSIDDLRKSTSKSKQAIQARIGALAEAELYLREYRETPESYEILRDQEQFFEDLAKLTKGKPVEEQTALRNIYWRLADSTNLRDRLYSYNSIGSKDNFVNFVEGIVTGINLDDKNGEKAGHVPSLTLGSRQESVFKKLNDWIDKSKESQNLEISTVIEKHAINFKAAEDSRKLGENPLQLVQQIHTRLSNLNVQNAASDTKEAITEQLKGILEKTKEYLRILHSE